MTVTAPFPDELHQLLLTDGFPRGDQRSAMPVAAYVRMPGGCVRLGALELSGGSYDVAALRVLTQRFALTTPLPVAVLDRIRSAVPSPPGPAAPDVRWLRLLPHDPVGALQEFVTSWYADVAPATGPRPEPAVPTPPPLTALHAAVAGRSQLLGGRDFLFEPHELRLGDDGRLLFGTENQGVFTMATEPGGDDPPVWFLRRGVGVERNPLSLSWFLLATALFEATVIGRYTMYGKNLAGGQGPVGGGAPAGAGAEP
ncbi:hypothetical protein [Dactylosporangium sp. NPDC000521]|uniref:hypothetical protein n=1 Tax=Dactylosporangium sp. NPDC000521 TaxID=3363975 RepID=UPI00369423C5